MKLPNIYANVEQKRSIDMTLSVNPLGCSPRVLWAIRSLTSRDVSQYPDDKPLQALLAKRFGVQPNNVLLGNGSEQLIKLVAQTFIRAGNQIRIERGSFGIFSKEALLAGGMVTLCDLTDMTTTSSHMIFIATPKTPTGECILPETILAIQKSNKRGIVVVDEANGELVDETSVPIAVKSKNIIVLRTLSKTFGMAGLRIGIAIGSPALISELRNAQQCFPVNQIAIQLAKAALTDRTFLRKSKQFVIKESQFLKNEIINLGLNVSRSVTNNLFISTPKTKQLINQLAVRGVSVIDGTFFPGMQTPGFRISIKDKKTNRLFLKKLTESLACINKTTLVRSKE